MAGRCSRQFVRDQPGRMTPQAPRTIDRAFDEIRFGALRTLDLRATMPTGAEAARRTESWLRERQVSIGGEVLIITGRGRGSEGGVPVVREVVRKLLTTLSRKGVVGGVAEHTAGSYVVMLAPVRALFEAGSRSRNNPPAEALREAQELLGLSEETREALRRLAIRALEYLGAPTSEAYVKDEMLRQFSVLAAAAPSGEGDGESRLRGVIVAALDAFDDEE